MIINLNKRKLQLNRQHELNTLTDSKIKTKNTDPNRKRFFSIAFRSSLH